MTGTLLTLPDDPRYQELIDAWPDGFRFFDHPRSAWLTIFEQHLFYAFPQSSSRDRTMTARHYAPSPLAAGHDVP